MSRCMAFFYAVFAIHQPSNRDLRTCQKPSMLMRVSLLQGPEDQFAQLWPFGEPLPEAASSPAKYINVILALSVAKPKEVRCGPKAPRRCSLGADAPFHYSKADVSPGHMCRITTVFNPKGILNPGKMMLWHLIRAHISEVTDNSCTVCALRNR
jgi:hypothetical protein